MGKASQHSISSISNPLKATFNATRDRGQKTEDCNVVNEGLVSRAISCTLMKHIKFAFVHHSS